MTRERKGAMATARKYITVLVAGIIALMFAVRALPIAWDFVQNPGDNATAVTTIPGGELFGEAGFVIIVLLVFFGTAFLFLRLLDIV